jgi:hypothetical protein
MAKEQDPKTVPERSLRASSNFFLTLYFGFKIAPSLGGILALYLVYRLFILGVTGQASLTVNSNSVGGQLLNAAPGLFFAVGGIVVLVAVVLKGVNLEMNNTDRDARGLGEKHEPRRYSGGGGGGGPDLRAGAG